MNMNWEQCRNTGASLFYREILVHFRMDQRKPKATSRNRWSPHEHANPEPPIQGDCHEEMLTSTKQNLVQLTQM
jgi:hypothetical protein